MREATLFLACLLLLLPKTFQVLQQQQRESGRFSFDQQILKRLSSRNLEGFKDTQGVTEKDGVAYDQNGLDKRRRNNGRKAPLNNVIETIEKLGFSDNWTKAGKPEPRTTSRFDTRVDYVFSSESFNKAWTLQSFNHFPYEASDHSSVQRDDTRASCSLWSSFLT